MLRAFLAFLCYTAVSGHAVAMTTLPKIEAVKLQISGTVLCQGDGCRGLFDTPQVVNFEGMYAELSPDAPTEPQPECSGDSSTREGAVWKAYQTALMLKHGSSAVGRIAALKEDEGNRGTILTITFSNGSTGEYRRTDSMLGGTHGFDEIKAPDCGKP